MPEVFNPQPGDFFLLPIDGRVGRLIRIAQWLNGDGFDPVQHAGTYLGHGYSVEAFPGGAKKLMMSGPRYDGIVWSTGAIELTPTQRNQVVAHALDYVGVGYSFLDYLGLALARFGLRPRWLKRYIGNTGHMICSQLVDQAYMDAGVKLFTDDRIPGDVTPADLYNLLRDLTHMDWVDTMKNKEEPASWRKTW
jgi:uncharacterized protein YycO